MEPALHWSYQTCTSTSTPQDQRHTPLYSAGIPELFRLRLLDRVLSGPATDVRDGGYMRTQESSGVYDTTEKSHLSVLIDTLGAQIFRFQAIGAAASVPDNLPMTLPWGGIRLQGKNSPGYLLCCRSSI